MLKALRDSNSAGSRCRRQSCDHALQIALLEGMLLMRCDTAIAPILQVSTDMTRLGPCDLRWHILHKYSPC